MRFAIIIYLRNKIVVVEDEEGLRLLYEQELKSEGYEVLTARNGREAIQQLEQGRPDLIILDIVMPVMDGMEALGRIVGKERKIPIMGGIVPKNPKSSRKVVMEGNCIKCHEPQASKNKFVLLKPGNELCLGLP